MIMSDYVSDDNNIYERTKSDEYHMELREGGTECTEDVTSDNYCCNEVDGQKFYTYLSQMAKYSDISSGQA
jgi:hypothetical protein